MTPGFMNAFAKYLDIDLHYFTLHISVANLSVIILMIVVFFLAVVLPFPGGKGANE
jgi:hypothetical protein